MNLSAGDIVLLVFIIVVAAGAGLYFLNRWASRKMATQQDVIEKTKMSTSIFVLDKKKDKITNANLPKAVMNEIPKHYKFMKVPIIKAKVGPQVLTLLCDKNVYEALPVKKNISVELAGIYIISMKGMKSKKEMKQLRKDKDKAKKDKDKKK